ncbi:MAG: LuxR family transcriptional regulator [Janthinobacterium lividum]
MDNWQEEQIQSLLNIDSEASFFKELNQIARGLGFEYCAYGMRLPLPVSAPKLVMLNNYSSAWQQRYAEQNYLAIDPTVAHGMRSVAPLIWSENVFANCRPFWEEAQAQGLRVGWALACHDARGIGGLLSLSRAEDPLTAKELDSISPRTHWLTQIAHQSLAGLLVAEHMPEANVQLTSREVEVLRWTADGKTSWETSDIMNISERTVNFHINNTMAKLGVSNKTAAAIKAAILGLLG